MQDSRRTITLLVLLAVCLVAAAYVALPFYGRYRTEAEVEFRRYHPSGAVLQLLQSETTETPPRTGQYPCMAASVTNSVPQVALAQCGSAAKPSGQVDSFEVDLRYGNFVLRQTDLYLNDIFEVPLTRTYNSGDYLAANRVHAFGISTNHPYDIAPVGSRFPYTYQMLVLEDGDFVYFPRVSQGTNYDDAVYQHTETSSAFYKAVTSWNGNGWTTWLADGSLIVFPEAYSATNAAQGAPVQMRNAAGNELDLLRDNQRNLQEIRTPHKHFIKFQYDDQARITRAEDDQGHWDEYRYNLYGMLTDAISSSGHARHYTYDNELMTVIEDENRHVLLHNFYNFTKLVRQDYGNGQVYSYDYILSPDGAYAESVNLTLPSGTKNQIEVGSAVPAAVKNPPQ